MYNYDRDNSYRLRESRDESESEIFFKSQFYSPLDIYELKDTYLKSLPEFMRDGTFGVDTLTISLALDEDSIDLGSFLENLIGKGNKTKGAVALADMPSPWIFWPSTGPNQRLRININPSNFSRQDGFELCPPILLLYYVKTAIRTILLKGDPMARPDFVRDLPYGEIEPWPENWASGVDVFEVHYARDIQLNGSDFDLEMLEDQKPKYAKATLVYRNEGIVETISHPGSKSVVKYSIYDKYRERQRILKSKKRYKNSYKPVPIGTKRFETKIPRAELKKKGYTTLDVFTPERILKSSSLHWKRSNYGQIIEKFTDVKWNLN
jgi:hypothetical protein